MARRTGQGQVSNAQVRELRIQTRARHDAHQGLDVERLAQTRRAAGPARLLSQLRHVLAGRDQQGHVAVELVKSGCAHATAAEILL